MTTTEQLDALEWGANNDISFTITRAGGKLVVRVEYARVASEWEVKGNDIPGVAEAVFGAIYSVRHGANFHRQYGWLPDADKLKADI